MLFGIGSGRDRIFRKSKKGDMMDNIFMDAEFNGLSPYGYEMEQKKKKKEDGLSDWLIFTMRRRIN